MTIASHPTCESKAYSCIYKRNWEGGGAVRGVAIFLVFISSIDIKVRKYWQELILLFFFILKSTKGNFTWRAFPYLYMNNIAQFFF